jgi:hypothetical protein
MADKLVYANSDATVHVKQGTVESQFGSFEIVEGRNLSVGDSLPLSDLASYQAEAIEAGDVPGLEVVSKSEADKKNAELERVKVLLGQAPGVVNVQTNVALGDDNSFSDHLVSDDERVANHVARAKDEAGESVSDDKVTVVGAESADSPAASGVHTRDDLDEVQGAEGAEAAHASKKSAKK